MSEKKTKRVVLFEGYQATFADLKNKDGKPLERKDLKPPKGGSAIRRPKPPATDKPSQA
jgi:hypothetical protein